jgi:cytochrome c peroxidase
MKTLRALGRLKIVLILLVGAIFIIFPSVQSATAEDLTPLETLGKELFFDSNLSNPQGQSCASCHDPAVGFTAPDSEINAHGAVMPGAVETRFGNRKPPSAGYGGDSPLLYYDEALEMWIGGMFWDGRATGWTLGDPLAEQAMGPFLNPLEMNMHSMRQVCIRVARSDYAPLFIEVWGSGSLNFVNDVEGTYERIVLSLAAYERSATVTAFTSKFDLFWDNARLEGKDITMITAAGIPGGMGSGMGGGGMGGGGMGGGGMGGGGMGGSGMGGSGMGGSGMDGGGLAPEDNPSRWEYYTGLGLTDEELQGLAIFNDPNRADCASCHSLSPGVAGYPLFTDFSYHNLGIPKNPENPYYFMPRRWNPDGLDWIDLGLGGFLENAGFAPEISDPEMGKFKTPSLRNVDLRPSADFVKAYGHNGFFKSLDGMDGIIHFYAWRATMDMSGGMGGGMGGGGMGGGGMGGGGMMAPDPDLFPPPELDLNRTTMTPFNFMMDGDRLLLFLQTLSDGYVEE